jgi:MFS transporter, ACDE family, multidrug resistance protein
MADHLQQAEEGRIFWNGNLQIVFLVTILSAIGLFSISPALPTVARDLSVAPADIGLILTIFALPGVFLMPLIGMAADRFGRKKVLGPALLLFGLSGGACLLIEDFKALLVLRFIQGVGGACLSSLNITVIGDLFSGRARATAMGYNQCVFSVGATVLTILGGALATIGWFYPFILPLAAIPVWLLVLRRLKAPEPKRTSRLREYFGTVAASLKRPQVFGIYVATMATFVLVSGGFYNFFPLLMDDRFHSSPMVIGWVMSSMMIASALSSVKMGTLVRHFPEKMLFKISMLLYAVSLALMPLMPGSWSCILPAAIMGLAQGMIIPVIQTLLSGLSTTDNRAVVLSFYGTSLRIGQTIGPVFMSGIYSFLGMSGVFYFGSVLALAMIGWLILVVDQETTECKEEAT